MHVNAVVDTLVTHPNVMNGASLYWPEENIMYVEGSALDQFAAGALGLAPMKKCAHRIGLLLDSDIGEEARIRHIQVYCTTMVATEPHL